ncbi:MAG: aminoacyl-tRNA hydrolase [Planctomycetaceae bacterium]
MGIGNPGERYRRTRHNVGFRVIDLLAERASVPLEDLCGIDAEGGLGRLAGRPVLLAKPTSFVNRCGPVLAALCLREATPLSEVLVVVDDFQLPLGRLRLRSSGGAGGHNGLTSILESLGSVAFPRLRLGIGDPGSEPAERYVLEPFAPSEEPAVARAVEVAARAVESWLSAGIERAMGEVNRRELDGAEGAA